MGVTSDEYRSRDLLVLKQTVCAELKRVTNTVNQLRKMRFQIAADLSVEDLLEIFCEEHDRLFRQLQAIDASLLSMAEEPVMDLLDENRQTEQKRQALSRASAFSFQ